MHGRYKEAEKTFRQVLEARKIKLGEYHPAILQSKNDLTVLYKKQGHHDDAEQLLFEIIGGRRLKLGGTPHTQQVQDRHVGTGPVFLLICIDMGLIITLWLKNQNSYQFISHTLLI